MYPHTPTRVRKAYTRHTFSLSLKATGSCCTSRRLDYPAIPSSKAASGRGNLPTTGGTPTCEAWSRRTMGMSACSATWTQCESASSCSTARQHPVTSCTDFHDDERYCIVCSLVNQSIACRYRLTLCEFLRLLHLRRLLRFISTCGRFGHSWPIPSEGHSLHLAADTEPETERAVHRRRGGRPPVVSRRSREGRRCGRVAVVSAAELRVQVVLVIDPRRQLMRMRGIAPEAVRSVHVRHAAAKGVVRRSVREGVEWRFEGRGSRGSHSCPIIVGGHVDRCRRTCQRERQALQRRMIGSCGDHRRRLGPRGRRLCRLGVHECQRAAA